MKLIKSDHLQKRSIDSFVDYPGLTEQLLAIQGLSTTSWSPPSIKEALSVPAVFRAVTLIANTVGSLTLQAWRNGLLMAVPPALVSRPGVFSTPRDFFRDTGYCLATRGEYIWWTVDRDEDGRTSRFHLLPPHEVTVRWDDNLPLVRRYSWRDKEIASDDIEHGTYLREPGALRGIGPLQICGAALSAGVEANEWAARFFARGGAPATVLESGPQLNPEEAAKLVDQWLLREGNEVRVTSGGVTVKDHQIDPESAQLLQSRTAAGMDAATMFGINPHLLSVNHSGSSLTYQNVGQAFDDFVRSTLAPNYLEPIEHGISEHLSRTTVARFALQALLRADVRTQADVYSTLIAAGMDEARAGSIAGIDSLVDTTPIPEPLRVPNGRIPVA